MNTVGRKSSFFILILLLCISCSKNKDIFSKFHSFKKAEWSRNDTAIFEVNVEDSLNLYDVSIKIRNNEDYPFRNIWLFVDFKTPEGELRTDTLGVDLADVYGKWYGKGLGLHVLSIPYETSVRFPTQGVYTFSIRQGMRENPLKGISDIGLKISR